MDKDDIVMIEEPDGTYGFYRFIEYSCQPGTDDCILERKDTSSPKVVPWKDITFPTKNELFEAYESLRQRLKETETAYQTLRQEHIDIVNDAQAHLRGPF